MLRKIIGVFLLIIIIGALFSSTTLAQSNIQCEEIPFTNNLGGFIFSNLVAGMGLFVFDGVISAISESPFGGWLEPIDQIPDLINTIWWQTMIWALISSLIGWMAGHFITVGISLNLMIAESPLIIYGGQMMLQIVNLGFIISIVIIGIATILRLQRDAYSADKLLLKLIIGIIFINLTIPIAIGLTNAGTRIVEVMYLTSAPCPGSITNQFTAWHLHGQIKQFLRAGDDGAGTAGEPADASGALQELGGILAAPITNLLALFAATSMSLIAGITFLALSLVLFIRFVLLMLLIAFAPIIWLGFIFDRLTVPGLNGNVWRAWWETFIRWNLIGPIMILFIGFTSYYLYAVQSTAATTGGLATNSALMNVAQLLVANIIMAMGIYIGLKASGAASILIMAGVAAGVGIVAGTTQKMIKNQQIKAQSRFDRLSAHEQQSAAGRSAQRTIKRLGIASNAAGLKGVGLATALTALNIKPKIAEVDEQKMKEKNLREGLRQAAYRSRKGTNNNQADTELLQFTNQEIKNMTESEKLTFAQAIQRLNNPNIKNNLSPKELLRLNQLNKDLTDIMNANIIDNLGMAGTNNASVLELNNLNTNNFTPSQKQAIITALSGVTASTLNSSQTAKLKELESTLSQDINERIISGLSNNPNSVLDLKRIQDSNFTPSQKQAIITALSGVTASTLNSSQTAKLKELESTLSQDINERIISGLSNNPNSVLDLKRIQDSNFTPSQKQAIITALSGVTASTLNSSQTAKFNELEQKLSSEIITNIVSAGIPNSIQRFTSNHIKTAGNILSENQKAQIEAGLTSWATNPNNPNQVGTQKIIAKIDAEKRKHNW